MIGKRRSKNKTTISPLPPLPPQKKRSPPKPRRRIPPVAQLSRPQKWTKAQWILPITPPRWEIPSPPASPPPPISNQQPSPQIETTEIPLAPPPRARPPQRNGEYGNKLVCVCFGHSRSKENQTWAMIDPNYVPGHQKDYSKFGFERLPKMKVPSHFDLYKCTRYGIVTFESNVYFIGGRNSNHDYDHYDDKYVDKVFIYNLVSETWEESSSRLNVPRASPQVIVVGKVIYVFGGESDYLTRDTWIECYGLDPNKNVSRKWKILPTRVPDELNNVHRNRGCILYENACEILFSDSRAQGVFAFNYVNKTWKQYCDGFHANVSLKGATIVGDILFSSDAGILYGYDLCSNAMILRYGYDFFSNAMIFRDMFSHHTCWEDDRRHLFRVGKNTLLVFWRSCGQPYRLYCWKYQIDYSLENSWGIRLVEGGFQRFETTPHEDICESFVV